MNHKNLKKKKLVWTVSYKSQNGLGSSSYYTATKEDGSYQPNIDPYGYNSHDSQGVENYELGSTQYQDAQKHIAAGRVPTLTSLNEKQRLSVRRRIISLYPGILNKNEAEDVRAWTFFSQVSGLAMLFSIPYWLISIQKAWSNSSGSLMKNRMVNRALLLQTSILFGAYYSYKSTISTLDKYSDKYLKTLDDESLLHFENQNRFELNRMVNSESSYNFI